MEERIYPYKVTQRCEECKEVFEWDGITLTSDPPQYRLICPVCGKEKISYQPPIHIMFKDEKGNPV